MNEFFFEKYFKLRQELDHKAHEVEVMHKAQINCKKGCDSCCESLTIFPIEYDSIARELGKDVRLPEKNIFSGISKKCRFLIDGACSIYNSRPIICRTQGLPLLYENRNGQGFELSVCKLNFVGVDVTKLNMQSSLFMPPFNSKLYLLNKDYVESIGNNEKPSKRYKLNKLSFQEK